MDKFDRIYQLHRILSARRHPVSLATLRAEMECGEATVKRAIRTLREQLGAPIFNERGKGWRYDPTQNFELPGMWFNADELAALVTVRRLLTTLEPGLLEEELRPLAGRVERLLERSAPGVAAQAGRIRILGTGARARALPRFDTVAGALLARRRLAIDYHARGSDARTRREVSPQRLTFYRDNWYLDAFCHLRGGLRCFAVERIAEARRGSAPARDVPAAELDAHYAAAYGIFAGKAEQTAVLRFSPRAARWVADERWHPEQEGRFLADGRYELAVPYGDPTELIMDVCRFGPEAEVVGPPGLREAVADRLRRAAAQYDRAPGITK